jgi:hypothetical protein
MYTFITGDESAGSHGEQDANLRRRLLLFLDMDDDDAASVVVDLRRLNTTKTLYDKFWGAMKAYLDKTEDEAKVNRSRHGSTCDTPIAWSIPVLVSDVKQHALHSDPPHPDFGG